jgi:hypothetical protein
LPATQPKEEASVSFRLFTFRLAVLVSLVLTAAANGGWKWTGLGH